MHCLCVERRNKGIGHNNIKKEQALGPSLGTVTSVTGGALPFGEYRPESGEYRPEDSFGEEGAGAERAYGSLSKLYPVEEKLHMCLIA
jgi:hypothetical protein